MYKCPPDRLPKHPQHEVTGKIIPKSGYIYLKYGGKDPTKFSPGEVAVHHMRHVLPVQECARMHITISYLEKLRKKLEVPSKIIGRDVRYTRFYRLVDVVRKPVPIPEKDVPYGRIGKDVFLTAVRAGGKFLTAQHDDPLPLTLSDMLKKETNAACLFSLSTRNGVPPVYCQALFIGTPGHVIWACVLRVYAQRRFKSRVVEPEAKRARR